MISSSLLRNVAGDTGLLQQAPRCGQARAGVNTPLLPMFQHGRSAGLWVVSPGRHRRQRGKATPARGMATRSKLLDESRKHG